MLVVEFPREPGWEAEYYAVPTASHPVPSALLVADVAATDVVIQGQHIVVSSHALCRWTRGGTTLETSAFFVSSSSVRCKVHSGFAAHTDPILLQYSNDGHTFVDVGGVTLLSTAPSVCSVRLR